MLLDDRDEDSKLLEVELGETVPHVRMTLRNAGMICGKKVTHLRPCVLNMYMMASMDGMVMRRKRRILEDGDERIDGNVLVVVVCGCADGLSELEEVRSAALEVSSWPSSPFFSSSLYLYGSKAPRIPMTRIVSRRTGLDCSVLRILTTVPSRFLYVRYGLTTWPVLDATRRAF